VKSGSKVLFVHTGGLQSVPGFEERFKLKLFDKS
jgi:1-aminocyclopropane-1-carboxylate deaminase/D-cysteine desulfhydrase-like pyridoxal-dependent ACC family enzyme